MMRDRLQVGTWNILGRRSCADGSESVTGLVLATLCQHPVDVLAVQEVHFYDGTPDPQLIAELRDAGLPYFVGRPFSPSHLDPDAQLGVGIAARFPILDASEYRLDNPGLKAMVRGAKWTLHDKGLVGAQVLLNEHQRVSVQALHLFPFFEFGVADDDDYVQRMWEEFWRYADKIGREGRTLLVGDFNQADRINAAKRCSELPWRFRAAELTTTTTGMSLDDIALNWGATVPQANVVPTFSDHHLVRTTVEM